VRFETAKAQLDKVQAAITQRQAQKKMLENFMAEFHRLPEAVNYFDEWAWYALVDFLTVYSKDDVRLTFKNGMGFKHTNGNLLLSTFDRCYIDSLMFIILYERK